MSWFIAILIFSIGASAFFFGWPGRLVSREPRCRACGYALTGVTHITSCTDCGKNFIGAHNPYTWSKRRRRGVPLIAGLTLSAAASVWLGFLSYAAIF